MYAAGKERGDQQTTILTIDDETAVRQSIAFYLNDLGYTVLEADNASTGLSLVEQNKTDLVLLDLRMPKISGMQFLEQVREIDSELPVIVISGTGNIGDVVAALRLGAWDFLLKPIEEMSVLQHSVEKALERSSLRQENLAYQKSLEAMVEQRTSALLMAYNQLEKSEEKYRAIYENLQDVYYEADIEGQILEVSPSVENFSFFSREELLGTSIWDYYANPADREEFLRVIEKEKRVSDYEIRLYDKDKRVVHFSVNSTLHPEQANRPAYISGILRNITSRKQAEEDLRNSKQTLEALFDAAPLAVLAIDPDLKITLWNQAAEEIFGWRRDEIIGKPYPLAVPGKENESAKNLGRALSGEFIKGLELTRQRKDGQLLNVSASTAPLKDTHGDICGAILIIEDISEKLRLRNEADRYSRLASLGELAAGVAHEINNPNGLIMLNLPTVRDFVMDAIALQQKLEAERPGLRLGGLKTKRAAEAFPQLMNEIEDGARRIKQIVEDLKDFSRQESLNQRERFDLNQSVEKATRLVANPLKKATTSFACHLAEGLPPIFGSPQRVEQVVVNLLVNACEALTDRTQKICIETDYIAETNKVLLRVRDEGRGIKPEHMPHITDPFFTTRREAGGTGLGLSVSARIVNEHKGNLDVFSEPDQGTVVTLSFPAASEEKNR